MERKWYGGDAGLNARMFLTMFLLFAVYAAFLYWIYQSGVDFITMAAIAVIFLLVQYFFSDQLVLLTTGARTVTPDQAPDLHARIDRLCQLADLPKPKVALMSNNMPNAFATGRGPGSSTVAVTSGLLSRLEGPELDAVLAHELSHIKNRDVAVMTIAGFLSTVAFTIVRFSMWFGMPGGDRRDRRSDGGALILGYLVAIAVWLISMLLIRALSRYREFAADRGSAIITGAPSQLASALVKISGTMRLIPDRDLRDVQGANAFFILPAVSRGSLLELFSTHPSLEKRLERLRRMEQQIEGLEALEVPRVGILDSIFGQRKPVKSKLDQLFAMSTAATTLSVSLRLAPVGKAGVCFRPVTSAAFAGMQADMETLLASAGKEFGTKVTVQPDSFGFLWVLLDDPEFEDLVTTIHVACLTLVDGGFGEQLLAAASRFRAQDDGRDVYWIYNYKRGTFYPFVPTGSRSRDNATEIRLSGLMEHELPIEHDMERWYPLWGLPV